MEVTLAEYISSNEDLKYQIDTCAKFYNISEEEVLKIGILTYIAKQVMPRYKDYKTIVSGVTQARMAKGVNSSKNFITGNVKEIVKIYGLNEINKNIVAYAVELAVMTFDSIFINDKNKLLEKKYILMLEDNAFLFLHIQLMVKILGETLYNDSNTEILNKTLKYVTEYLAKHKTELQNEIIEAYLSEDQDKINEAKKNYGEKMEEILKGYIDQLRVPLDEATKVGKELEIEKKLGTNSLDEIITILIEDTREQIKLNNNIQRKFF